MKDWLATALPFALSPLALERCDRLYQLVLAGNAQQNLTRLTTPEAFWEKHLWDSLFPLAGLADRPWQVIDVGTGAGFPGLPAAIAFPHWHLTLLDGTRKKIAFVQEAIAALELTNAQGVWSRAEAFRPPQPADLVLIRAVTQPATALTYALPLLGAGGRVLLYRGRWSAAEETELQRAGDRLGARLLGVQAFVTPLSQGQRHVVCCERL
ncbi:MAG: 16S rRNA (guanine(527)-N(7))-methyltransferase RsmG [Pseudanabaenaceae cyanobacterium]